MIVGEEETPLSFCAARHALRRLASYQHKKDTALATFISAQA